MLSSEKSPERKPARVYAHGTAIGDIRSGGWAASLKTDTETNLISGHADGVTEMEMELEAIYQGLHALDDRYRLSLLTSSRQVREVLREEAAAEDNYLRIHEIKGELSRHDFSVGSYKPGNEKRESLDEGATKSLKYACRAAVHGNVLEEGEPSVIYFQGEAVGTVLPLAGGKTRLMLKPIIHWYSPLSRFADKQGGMEVELGKPAHIVVGHIVELADPHLECISSRQGERYTIYGDTYGSRLLLREKGMEFRDGPKVWQTYDRDVFYSALVDAGARMDSTHSALVPGSP